MAAIAVYVSQNSGTRLRTEMTSASTADLASTTHTEFVEAKAETSGSLPHCEGFSQTEVKEVPEARTVLLRVFQGGAA